MIRRTMAAVAGLAMMAGAAGAAGAQGFTGTSGSWSGSGCQFGGDVCLDWVLTWEPLSGHPDYTHQATFWVQSRTTRTAAVFIEIVDIPFRGYDLEHPEWDGFWGVFHEGTRSATSTALLAEYSPYPVNGMEWHAQVDGPGGERRLTKTPGTLDVNFSAVPEPGTYALLGSGLLALGGVGLARRRREG